MSLTTREYFEIKDILNQFCDRWPETYNLLYHRFPGDERRFSIAVLWQFLKWANPDKEDAIAISGYIQKLGSDHSELGKQGQVKFKTKIDEIECDGQL